jgi:hypothetical protein
MGLLSCLFGNRPSKWLTNREKLLIFMRIFLLILAFVQEKNRVDCCNFYQEMYSFVNLSKEYLSKYDELTGSEKKSNQRRLHEILKRMCHNHTYVIGGTWGQSWTLPQLYAFYQAVLFDLKQDPYPGVIGIGKRYYLPGFSYLQSTDPLIRQKIDRDLFGISFNLPREMCQAFPVIFESELPSQPLNVPPPVVSKPFVYPSASWTHLGAVISASNLAKSLATPREYVRSPPTCDDHTPVEVISTPREICTPRAPCTPRTPRFSKWLLQELLSKEFLQFLQQQSQQSSCNQLKKMFGDIRFFYTQYSIQLFRVQNPITINSFFQALGEYPVVKTALKLYRGKPLDGWMDIRIVSESNEEDQKRFYEYLKMMIHLKVWLCDDAEKEEFSAECDGKLWVFCDETDSFKVHYLPQPELPGPAIHLEQSGIA